MKPFDLAAAKAGAPVCTGNGEKVRIICFDRISRAFPILALRIDSGNEEYTTSFTIDGRRFLTGTTDGDLVMRDDDYAEKLARGEYAPSVKENLTVENPTCKESLPVDREYWRRVYAGQAMQARITTTGLWDVEDTVHRAVIIADALIAELKKTEK